MHSATPSVLPTFPSSGYNQPAGKGRTVGLGLGILAGHVLLLWAWLAVHGTAEWRRVEMPLIVSLMPTQRQADDAAPALPLPRRMAPAEPLPMPAPPIIVSAPPTPSSLAAEPGPPLEALTSAQPATSMAVAAAPTPMPAPSPRLPVQIPPSAVQYLEPPRLVYPRASARNGERGRVTVRVFIDSRGWPQQVEVAVSSGFVRLDEAAVAAVRQARFKPYQVDGMPVAGWALVPADFDA